MVALGLAPGGVSVEVLSVTEMVIRCPDNGKQSIRDVHQWTHDPFDFYQAICVRCGARTGNEFDSAYVLGFKNFPAMVQAWERRQMR